MKPRVSRNYKISVRAKQYIRKFPNKTSPDLPSALGKKKFVIEAAKSIFLKAGTSYILKNLNLYPKSTSSKKYIDNRKRNAQTMLTELMKKGLSKTQAKEKLISDITKTMKIANLTITVKEDKTVGRFHLVNSAAFLVNSELSFFRDHILAS